MKTKLKKVKIDDHIRKSKTVNPETLPRKRGRPRKDHNVPSVPEQTKPGRDTLNQPPLIRENDRNNQSAPLPATIQPIYDTTEEAKAVLRTPFEVAAGLTGIPKLALQENELLALAPSFKIVYDKRIAPYLGENADLYAFGMAMTGILFSKIIIYKEETKPKKSEYSVSEHAQEVKQESHEP